MPRVRLIGSLFIYVLFCCRPLGSQQLESRSSAVPPVRAAPSRQPRVERLPQRSPDADDEERRLARRWSYHCNRPDLTLQDRAKMQSVPELKVGQCGAKFGQCGAPKAILEALHPKISFGGQMPKKSLGCAMLF